MQLLDFKREIIKNCLHPLKQAGNEYLEEENLMHRYVKIEKELRGGIWEALGPQWKSLHGQWGPQPL